jgi:hypothetical protein
MKNIIYAASLIMLVFICACNKDSNSQATFTGKWKLTAAKVGTGGPGQWVTISGQQSDTSYVQFNPNGKLLSTAFAGYTSYVVKDSVTVVFAKDDNTKENYSYSINNGLLDLSPAGPIFCTEGCTYRFSRY